MTKKREVRPAGAGTSLIPPATGRDKTALVPTNPRVANIAFRLRWDVNTVIRRVESALPSKIEQQVYLRVAGGYRIHPESLRKLLEVFRGNQELRESDLKQVVVGENLVTSRFDEVMEKIEQSLVLLDKKSDGAEYMMSMVHAAKLVEAYGEHSMEVFGEITENISRVADLLKMRSQNARKVVGVAIAVLVDEVLAKRGSVPLPLTIDEMFGKLNEVRHE